MAGPARWWPWRRPRPTPAETPAPSLHPRWQALAPIQRTVDGMTPTAPLDGFSASLTTAQNPGLISSAAMLATGHTASLAILGTGERTTASAPSNAAVPQARSWQRSVSLPQRMLPAPPIPVQRSPDTAPPMTPDVTEAADHVEPAPTSVTPMITAVEPAPGTTPLTQAADVGEYREVPVVTPRAPVRGTVAPEPPIGAAPSPLQRLPDVAAPWSPPSPTPTAMQRTATPTAPLRTVPQRAGDTAHGVVQRGTTTPPPPSAPRTITEADATESSAVPAPVLDDPPPDQPVSAVIDIANTAESPAARPLPHDVQRSVQSEPITWFSPDDPVRLPPAAHHVAVDRPEAGSAVAVQRMSTQPPTAQPPTAQPSTAQPSTAPSAPTVAGREPPPSAPPAAPAPTAVVAQRVRRHDPSPAPDGAAAQPDSVNPVHETTALPPPPAREARHTRPDAPTAAEPTFAEQRVATPTRPAPPVPLPSVGIPQAQQTSAVVRSVVPEVQRTVSPAAPEPAVAAVPRRLVVLPPLRAPVRPVTRSAETPTVQQIAESPAPVPLQRMFEHSAAPPDPRDRPSAATPFPPPASVTQHDGYKEVSFDQHSVQRDAEPSESPTPAEEPGVPPAPVTATPAASPATTGGAAPAAGGNIDELVNRLYDPLAARLRSELWLDRERAGVLMDLRR